MILSEPIDTPRLLLKTLQPADVGHAYFSWLSDPAVIRFLEQRFAPVTNAADLNAFVQSVNSSADSLLLGIFLKEGLQHIGNIKLGPLNTQHRRAEIGFLIGEKDCWGHGYASEAIAALTRHAFDIIGLDKVTSGCYASNIGSARALLKAGFVHEATIPAHVLFEGERIASWLFGVDRPAGSGRDTVASP